MNPSESNQQTDQEALQTIGQLEAEDNPSTETIEAVMVPIPVPVPTAQMPTQTPPAAASTAEVQPEKETYTGPIISGPAKSSKLAIGLLIFTLVLIIGATIAYLHWQ